MDKESLRIGCRALPRYFYQRSTAAVALDLLGCLLRHRTAGGIISGRIVEVEAYLGRQDPASHAFRGPIGRAKIFWQGAGLAYIYLSYGVHVCFNVTTQVGQEVGGVLVRALEPVDGLERMKSNRGTVGIRSLASGPGKLTRALAISLADNGRDITRGELTIAPCQPPSCIVVTPRVGISRANEVPLRFYEDSSQDVSHARLPVCFKGKRREVDSFLSRYFGAESPVPSSSSGKAR